MAIGLFSPGCCCKPTCKSWDPRYFPLIYSTKIEDGIKAILGYYKKTGTVYAKIRYTIKEDIKKCKYNGITNACFCGETGYTDEILVQGKDAEYWEKELKKRIVKTISKNINEEDTVLSFSYMLTGACFNVVETDWRKCKYNQDTYKQTCRIIDISRTEGEVREFKNGYGPYGYSSYWTVWTNHLYSIQFAAAYEAPKPYITIPPPGFEVERIRIYDTRATAHGKEYENRWSKEMYQNDAEIMNAYGYEWRWNGNYNLSGHSHATLWCNERGHFIGIAHTHVGIGKTNCYGKDYRRTHRNVKLEHEFNQSDRYIYGVHVYNAIWTAGDFHNQVIGRPEDYDLDNYDYEKYGKLYKNIAQSLAEDRKKFFNDMTAEYTTLCTRRQVKYQYEQIRENVGKWPYLQMLTFG